VNESAAQPLHDETADEELSTSLAGHSALPDADGEAPAPSDAPRAEDADLLDEDSPVLEEIDNSPVRTENS
jgi:hypothetical protein